MENLPKRRLRSALLDLLTEPQPRPARAGSADELAALCEQVRRDIGWLFNTTQLAPSCSLARFPEVERSVVNFGIPALTGRTLSSIDRASLQQSVLEALWRFEPRFVRDTLEVEVRAGASRFGVNALVIDIRAELWAEPLPLPLYLRTEIDLESGRIAVEALR